MQNEIAENAATGSGRAHEIDTEPALLAAALLRTSLECIVVMDETGCILEFNRAAEATFGYRRGEVLGRTVADAMIPPHLRAAHWRGLEKFLATGEGPVLGRRIEMPAMRADGSQFPVELTITATRLPSHRPVFIAYVRDITERVAAAEAHLGQAARKGPASAASTEEISASPASEPVFVLRTFCAGLAHDLANLLMPLRLRLESMGRGDAAKQHDQDLTSLHHTTEHLRHLVNGLRLLASDPRQPPTKQRIDLNQWWLEAEMLLKSVLPPRVRLEQAFAPDVPRVDFPSQLLLQSIFNCVHIAGASVAGQHGGRVTVWARPEHAPEGGVRTVLLGVVADSPAAAQESRGGVPERRFATLHTKLQSELGGDIVLKHIENAGGRLSVEPGGGAAFVLSLPARND